MGALTLPASGLVYIDTMVLIYTVERFPTYWPLLEPLWLAVAVKLGGGFQRLSTLGLR